MFLVIVQSMTYVACLLLVGVCAWSIYATPPGRRWRKARWWLVAGVVGYVAIMGLLMFLESIFIYVPTKANDQWEEPGTDLRVEDVWFTAADGNRIHAWWCPLPPKQEKWVLLYCHGNAGNLSFRQGPIHMWQQQAGASVLIFDYPGYGHSDGKPSEAGCYAATRAAYDWLTKEKRVPAEKLAIYGKSLGGAMAVELAANCPCRALVLISAFTSVPDMAQAMYPIFPARWMVRTRFDNLTKIAGYQGPLFVAHGTDDDLIPYQHGERLFEAAGTPANLKRFYAIPGGTHDDTAAGKEFYAEVGRWLAELPESKSSSE